MQMTFPFGHMELGTEKAAKLDLDKYNYCIIFCILLCLIVFAGKYLYLFTKGKLLRGYAGGYVVGVTTNMDFSANFLVQSWSDKRNLE